MNYWKECIAEAFEESGIKATDEQITNVAEWVEGAHENYGMAHGHDCIANPLEDELRQEKLKTKTAEEKAERERDNFRRNVATRRRVRPEQVEITDAGEVTYYP